MELKGVVEAQQTAMQQGAAQQPRPAGAGRAPGAANPAASARPHVAQLQRLVQDMRAELRQPPAVPGMAAQPADAAAGWHTTGWDEQQPDRQQQAEQAHQAALLAEELASTQARLQQLQESHDALRTQQVAWHSWVWSCNCEPAALHCQLALSMQLLGHAFAVHAAGHILSAASQLPCRQSSRTAAWRPGHCRCSWSMRAGGLAGQGCADGWYGRLKCMPSFPMHRSPTCFLARTTNFREAETARTEKERLRRALIDAEIELQRKSNDAAAAAQQAEVAQAAQASAAQAAAARQEQQLAAAAAELAAAQADAASLRQQLSAVRAAADEAAAASDARLRELQSAADRASAAAAAAEASATTHRQQREATDALVAQLQSQVAQLQAAATSSSANTAAEVVLLHQQLSAVVQREQAQQDELRQAREQLATLKQAHGDAVAAARSSQQQLQQTQVGGMLNGVPCLRAWAVTG